jgi:hypothetical protein
VVEVLIEPGGSGPRATTSAILVCFTPAFRKNMVNVDLRFIAVDLLNRLFVIEIFGAFV